MEEEINLKTISQKYNIFPKKKLGQNFIFDKNILNKILNNVSPIKGHNIIEIGPGPGGLTLEILKKKPNRITLVEKDSSFQEILNNIILEFKEVRSSIIIEDFLNLNLNKIIKPKTKIISNLPYYVSTQILLKILPLDKNIEEVMFTFQTEVANRIISKPHNKNYSRLSVITQSVCDIKKKQDLSSKIFYPIPKVNSTVLVFRKKKKITIKNFQTLKNLTHKAFNKRRKSIKNSLKDFTNITELLNKSNISESLRPEEITVEKFCELSNLIDLTKK